jgi:hypothetical protein
MCREGENNLSVASITTGWGSGWVYLLGNLVFFQGLAQDDCVRVILKEMS